MKVQTVQEILDTTPEPPTVEFCRDYNAIVFFGGDTRYTKDEPYEIDLDKIPDDPIEDRVWWAMSWMAHLTKKVWFTDSSLVYKCARLLTDAIARPPLDRLADV